MSSLTRILPSAFVVLVTLGSARAQLAQIPPPRLSYVRTVTSEQFLVTGEVTARTDVGFTVLGRNSESITVQVTENTAFLKGAASIKLSDLFVGDKVTVTLVRAGDGQLQAVNVTVRVGNE